MAVKSDARHAFVKLNGKAIQGDLPLESALPPKLLTQLHPNIDFLFLTFLDPIVVRALDVIAKR